MKAGLIWVIAGTSDARILIGELLDKGVRVCASVATKYGQRILAEEYPLLRIVCKRMEYEEMLAFLKMYRPSAVVDATHPYAQIVTKNISQACEETATKFYRLYRPEGNCYGQIKHVADMDAAVDFLQTTTGKIFLTTGSKELDVFCRLDNYQERIYTRILPMVEGLSKAVKLGFAPSQIICMQGPFSKELNKVMLKDSASQYLVTKNSGSSGGFMEKLEAAEELNIQVVVVGRPPDVQGIEYKQLLQELLIE